MFRRELLLKLNPAFPATRTRQPLMDPSGWFRFKDAVERGRTITGKAFKVCSPVAGGSVKIRL